MFFPTNLPCVLLFFNWNPLSTTTEALVLAEAVAGGAYSAQELSKVSRLRLDNCAWNILLLLSSLNQRSIPIHITPICGLKQVVRVIANKGGGTVVTAADYYYNSEISGSSLTLGTDEVSVIDAMLRVLAHRFNRPIVQET